MRVRFTPRAAADLDRVLTSISTHSTSGMRTVAARVTALIETLRHVPEMGELTSNRRVRRVVVVPHPYLIFYEASEDEITIVGVRHGRRSPRTMPGRRGA